MYFQINEPDLSLSTDYYLDSSNTHTLDALVTYMATVPVLFGADPNTAQRDAEQMHALEKDIAKVGH